MWQEDCNWWGCFLPFGRWQRDALRCHWTSTILSWWEGARGQTHFCSACCPFHNQRPGWHFLHGNKNKITYFRPSSQQEASQQTNSSPTFRLSAHFLEMRKWKKSEVLRIDGLKNRTEKLSFCFLSNSEIFYFCVIFTYFKSYDFYCLAHLFQLFLRVWTPWIRQGRANLYWPKWGLKFEQFEGQLRWRINVWSWCEFSCL